MAEEKNETLKSLKFDTLIQACATMKVFSKEVDSLLNGDLKPDEMLNKINAQLQNTDTVKNPATSVQQQKRSTAELADDLGDSKKDPDVVAKETDAVTPDDQEDNVAEDDKAAPESDDVADEDDQKKSAKRSGTRPSPSSNQESSKENEDDKKDDKKDEQSQGGDEMTQAMQKIFDAIKALRQEVMSKATGALSNMTGSAAQFLQNALQSSTNGTDDIAPQDVAQQNQRAEAANTSPQPDAPDPEQAKEAAQVIQSMY